MAIRNTAFGWCCCIENDCDVPPCDGGHRSKLCCVAGPITFTLAGCKDILGNCLQNCSIDCMELEITTEWNGIPGGAPITGKLCWNGSRFYGTGGHSSTWIADVSGPTYDASGCATYTIRRLRVVCGGVTVVWSIETDAAGYCGIANYYRVSATDTTIDDTGCPEFSIVSNGYPIPLLQSGFPANVSVTIAGATGTCCTDLNGTHVLTFDVSTLVDSTCKTQSRGGYSYKKTLPTVIGCSARRITLSIDSTADCTVVVDLLVEYHPTDPASCKRRFRKTFCPTCGSIGSIDFATDLVSVDDGSDCGVGDPLSTCDLRAITVAGTFSLGA